MRYRYEAISDDSLNGGVPETRPTDIATAFARALARTVKADRQHHVGIGLTTAENRIRARAIKRLTGVFSKKPMR